MLPLPLRTRGGVSIINTKTTSTTNIKTTSTVNKTQQRLPLRTRPRPSPAKPINTADKTRPANHAAGVTFAAKQRARMPTPCRMICAPLAQRMEEHHQRWQAKLRAEERDAAATNKARRAKKVADRRSRSPSASSSPGDVSDGDEGIAVPVRSRAASPAESLHSYFASDDECESGDEDEEMSDADTEDKDEDDSNNISGTNVSPPAPSPSLFTSSSDSPPSASSTIHPSTLVTTPNPAFNNLYSTAEHLHSNYLDGHTSFETARDGLRALQDQMPWGPYKKAVAELGRNAALQNKRASPPGDADATRQFNSAHLRCALWNTYGPGAASVEVGRMWAAARRMRAGC